MLPAGSFVPRSITGNCMRDRILEWHRQHPNQTAAGMLSYAPGTTELRSSMLWTITDSTEDTATSAYSMSEDVAPSVPQKEAPQPANQPIASESHPAPPPPAPVPTEMPEHPFSKARDATYAPHTTTNVGAPSKPSKDVREPAYRNVVPIESTATADQVLTQVLKNSNVSLTHEQLFSVSPVIRDKPRTLLTPKRVTNEASNYLASSYSNPVLPSVEELLRQADAKGSLPRGVLRIPGPYEAYLSRLGPHDTPQLLTVAKESHALRSILSTIADREEVECVVDPGCQIVSMSEAVCHALGLSYDPSIILHMQSANGNVDRSLGLARDVPFRVGNLVLFMHVIREAAYDILLGRPFDVLTESVVQNYRNEDQTLELYCPNSNRVATVPTFPRGKPRYRLPQGFSIRGIE